jgi:hypothetical protein
LVQLIVLVRSCLLLTDVALGIGIQHIILHLLLDKIWIGAFKHT